jgi:Short C-terminal domain
MTLHRIGMILWVPGTILVVLGWTGHVSSGTSWLGFILALVGAVMTWIPGSGLLGAPASPSPAVQPPRAPSPADEIAKLGELRERGLITPEEFDLKKKQLLRQIGNDSPGARQAD